MDMDKTLENISMNRKIQRAKKLHPYPIYHTEKSGWFTVVDDNTAPTGKRKIRKATEEKLWDELVDVYIDNKIKMNLLQVFPEWIESKETPRNGENIKRLKAEWKAYYEQEPISSEIISKPLSCITSLELREWAEKLLKKHYPVDKKKFSRIFTIISQCYEYAVDEDREIITENTWQKARKKINRDLVVANPLPYDDEQVFTDDERRQATNNGVKEWAKTANGYRDIPLTQNALKILEDVKAFNEEHGYNAEWIFQSGNADYKLFKTGFLT